MFYSLIRPLLSTDLLLFKTLSEHHIPQVSLTEGLGYIAYCLHSQLGLLHYVTVVVNDIPPKLEPRVKRPSRISKTVEVM